MQKAPPSCGSCCASGIAACVSPVLGRLRPTPSVSQEEFEGLVGYLTAVPIFRTQLPRSELPRVARALRETVWQPGAVVARRGKEGRAFYIIKSGRAAVMLPGPDGRDEESTALYAKDYFGGHTLVERRTNVATITAKGPEPLVTLSMDKADFEKLGINRMMTFPRRPAIYDGERAHQVGSSLDAFDGEGAPRSPLCEEELAFLSRAVLANQNLRQAFGDEEVCSDKVRAFVRGARKMRVAEGTDLAKSGEHLHELYVVASGAFSVVFGGSVDELRSAEECVGNLTKVRKGLQMKEQFVRELEGSFFARKRAPNGRQAFSMKVARAKGGGKDGSGAFLGRAWTSHSVSKVAKSSPFTVGERVARIRVGESLVREAGTVAEVTRAGQDGEVLVEFSEPPRQEVVPVQELRPADASEAPLARLTRGACYGELSLLYNTRLVTTCRAIEDSEVYVLRRRGFKEAFSRENASLDENIKLLDDVQLLTALVRSERWALARSATGVQEFAPGEVVIRQGEPLRDHNYLYVVKSGSCIVKQETSGEKAPCDCQEKEFGVLRRTDTFGERDIFMNRDDAAEATMQAGPEGLSVLLIHGDILRQFVAHLELGAVKADFAEYMQMASSTSSTSSREMQRIPFSDLELVRILGEGGFGSVFHARTAQGGEYALKRLSKGFVVKAQAEKQVALEREMLTMVDSDFIIRLIQTYKDTEFVYLLLEFCGGGHLFDVLNWEKVGGPTLLPSSVMFYVGSLTFALEHLHERRIAFRDLKAENVLLDSTGYVKLCDLGFAKFVVDKTHTLLGTPEYMAPETIRPPHAHDHMVDWWALGVLTFELLTGQIPWANNLGVSSADPVRRMLAIRDSHGDGFHQTLIPARRVLARNFVRGLLTINPRKRLGCAGGASVRQHPWFTAASFDFDALYRRAMPAPPPPKNAGGAALGDGSQGGPESSLSADSALFAPAVSSGSDWDSEF